MEVDASNSLRDPTSDQITMVKAKEENHKNKTGKLATLCEINKSDDAYNSGENCMVAVTNSNSIEAKRSGEVHPETKKVRPGKREREALRLNGQCKSSCGDGSKVHRGSPAVNGTNLPGGSDVDNNPDTRGCAVAEDGANLQTTKRKRRKRDKRHDCNDSENVEVSNTISTEIECRSTCRNCISKEIVSTEGGPVSKNVMDLKGGAVADGNTGLPGGAVADRDTGIPGDAVSESDINLHGQKRKKRNKSKRQNGDNSDNFEVSNTTSTLNTEFKASCENYTSKETIVTRNGAVTESDSDLQGKKKRKKKRKSGKEHNVNIEALCEEENPKSEQISLPSSPVRGAMTEAVPLSSTVPTENDGLSSSGTEGSAFLLQVGESSTSNAVVLKELVPPGKKKLLVLDINGLLADINTDFSYTKHADYRISGKLVFKRPFCADFLNFCFANFEIGVWSSRKRYNVEKAVTFLMGDLKNKLLFCWDQSKCTATNFNTIDNAQKPLVFKELKKLWEKEEPDLPWEKGRFTPSNTLLVDDSPYKALCNPPFTAIFPCPYSFKHRGDNSLGRGGDLRVYLENVVTAEHVQYYVKDNPFGQPAITDSHPSWKYYLHIIDNLDKPLVST